MAYDDLDYDMYIEQINKKRYKMKVVEESYEIMNEMLADETLTTIDQIYNLKSFIKIVEHEMLRIILSSDEFKECNDLLKAFENKIKELEEVEK